MTTKEKEIYKDLIKLLFYSVNNFRKKSEITFFSRLFYESFKTLSKESGTDFFHDSLVLLKICFDSLNNSDLKLLTKTLEILEKNNAHK